MLTKNNEMHMFSFISILVLVNGVEGMLLKVFKSYSRISDFSVLIKLEGNLQDKWMNTNLLGNYSFIQVKT